MNQKVAKRAMVFVLVFMGASALMLIPEDSNPDIQSAVVCGIIILCAGCYYLLSRLLKTLGEKNWLDTYPVPKSLVLSLIVLGCIRMVILEIVKLFVQ